MTQISERLDRARQALAQFEAYLQSGDLQLARIHAETVARESGALVSLARAAEDGRPIEVTNH